MNRKDSIMGNRNGVSMILVVIALLVLLGITALAVDVGLMYTERAKRVTAADAAALAGAYKLGDGNLAAVDEAIRLAHTNGLLKDMTLEEVDGNTTITGGDSGITTAVVRHPEKPDEIHVTADSNEKKVEVVVLARAGLFFASVLGQQHADINARAVAKAGAAGGVKGIMPIGVDNDYWDKLAPGDDFLVKLNSKSTDPNHPDDTEVVSGNFHALDFTHHREGVPDVNGNEYKAFLATGYPGVLNKDDVIYTETGVKAGLTRQGLDMRVGSCTCNDPNTCPAENEDSTFSCSVCQDDDVLVCPRICIVPVVETFDLSGKKATRILTFAVIFIESHDKHGQVTGVYMDEFTVTDPSAAPWAEIDYGVRSIKLVE